jgi:hypothetical protein
MACNVHVTSSSFIESKFQISNFFFKKKKKFCAYDQTARDGLRIKTSDNIWWLKFCENLSLLRQKISREIFFTGFLHLLNVLKLFL